MIAIAALCDWLKTLVTVFKPKGGKTTHHFSRVLRKLQVNARNSDWFKQFSNDCRKTSNYVIAIATLSDWL